jgi:hypothetical protein
VSVCDTVGVEVALAVVVERIVAVAEMVWDVVLSVVVGSSRLHSG